MTETPTPTVADGPATVVLLQSVRDGVTDAYRAWQDQTNAVAATFPGFLGAQVTPPSGIQTDWLVVYRFATEEQLQTWLASPQLAAQLRAGESFFASPQRQLVSASAQSQAPDAVSVVIRHHIRPGQEAAYAVWQQDMATAEKQAPGYLGTELIPPGPGSEGVYSAILRFDTADHLEAWMSSSARNRLLERGKSIYNDFDATRVRAGFDGWFAFGQGAVARVPPPWKQSLAVLFGLYPTVMVLSLFVTKHLPWTMAQSILLGNFLSTWVLALLVMPVVNWLLRFWLLPRKEHNLFVDVRGVVVIGLALFAMMFFFQFLTPHVP